MKVTKQARAALFVMLISISILPGCGKSKNKDNPPPPTGGAVIVQPSPYPGSPGTGGGYGGCYNTTHLFNTGLTMTFSGNIYTSAGVTGQLSFYAPNNIGVPSGYTNTYWRQTAYGDRSDIAISGSAAFAMVSASPSAITLVNAYGGQICGYYMNVSVFNPAVSGSQWSGNIGGGYIGLVTNTGYIVQL